MSQTLGEIIIRQGVKPWPHELRTAEALSAAGLTVVFIERCEQSQEKSADVLINGDVYEMKSPRSSRLSNIGRTLQKALHQSRNIVYDAQRVKNLRDFEIQREIEKQAKLHRKLNHLIFINKQRRVMFIK